MPLVVWITGGTRCSSTLDLLVENIPCSVAKGGHSTVINPYFCIETRYALCLDQYAVGEYSYGNENNSNEAMSSEDAYFFLQDFFKKHPEYISRPLYVMGDIYMGHYTRPFITKSFWRTRIWQRREWEARISLKSILRVWVWEMV